ncbi:MAG: flagellar protein FlgN [Firmicutes bacterium]|nr:flagellar protein FlgN [Bacillota bacterium]
MAGEVLKSLLIRITELTARKREFLEDVLRLTSEQSGFLVPEKSGELLAVIERKQACLDGINNLDGEIALLEKEIISIAGVSTLAEGGNIFGAAWETIDGLRGEISSLLQEIQSLDSQNRRSINEEWRKLKKSMEATRKRRVSTRAYTHRGTTTQSGGCFIDKRK